jgi:hypothetical protein
MAWQDEPRRRPRDANIMFVVGYADGRTAYITISPKALERVNDDPRAVVAARQKKGEIPEGEVVTVKRAR